MGVSFERADVVYGLLSDVISNSAPKPESQCLASVLAHSEVDMLLMRISYNQRLFLPKMIGKPDKHSEGGKEPTKLICMSIYFFFFFFWGGGGGGLEQLSSTLGRVYVFETQIAGSQTIIGTIADLIFEFNTKP